MAVEIRARSDNRASELDNGIRGVVGRCPANKGPPKAAMQENFRCN